MGKKFEILIQQYKEQEKKTHFEGTFLEYLQLVKENPFISMLSHERVYKMIVDRGNKKISPEDNVKFKKIFGNKQVKSFNFFNNEFFGIEEVLQKIVRYFRSASFRGEESRQVLYLVGPVGAGKSSLIEKIKRELEQTQYIYHIKDCPMREEPLHLIPDTLRGAFENELEVQIEGNLCPACKFNLEHKYNGNFEKVPIIVSKFSASNRIGIGVVPPVDPNNQDTSVLIGSEDISKLDKYPEGDPRILSLDGAFNTGNRGVVEFIEVFKNEIEYLHSMLTATQEKSIPSPGKHAMIYFDGVILAHSNEAEWNKFKSDHTNEAILDRIVKIEVPYVLELSEEEKIYKKILSKSNFNAHIAPHTLEIASMFAILTRLQETSKCNILTKLKLYNGDDIVEKGQTNRINVQELKEEFENEGMNGISTRFIMKSIDDALSESKHKCINPIYVIDAINSKLKEEPISDDVKKSYFDYLRNVTYKEYLKILEKEITKAFVYSYEDQAQSLFENYMDHVEAYVLNTNVVDRNTKEEMKPDKDFLKSIEEQIGITGTAAEGFRSDVLSYSSSIYRKGGSIDYKSYEPLKEAIEKKLMSSVKDLTRIITKSKTHDKEQLEKYDNMVNTMIENGYCEYCVDVVLKFAANNLWRD